MFKIWTEKQKDYTIFFMQHGDEIRNVALAPDCFENLSTDKVIDTLMMAIEALGQSLFPDEAIRRINESFNEKMNQDNMEVSNG